MLAREFAVALALAMPLASALYTPPAPDAAVSDIEARNTLHKRGEDGVGVPYLADTILITDAQACDRNVTVAHAWSRCGGSSRTTTTATSARYA